MINFKENIFYPVRINSHRVFFLLLFFLVVRLGIAQVYHYDINHEIKEAYALVEQLKLDEAQIICNQLKETQPSNLIVYHVENYIDFFRCFITEEDEVFDKLEKNKAKRLDILSKGDPSSPYYRFSRAEVLLQWSLVEIKYKNYITALLNLNKATGLLEENKKAFPEFLLNNKSLSVVHALVGTIPETYKRPLGWVSSFGGTIDQGYQEISEMTCDIDEDNLFYREVIVIKALIELHLVDDKDAAWETVSQIVLDVKSSPLMYFVTANVAHRSKRNDIAISILEKHDNEGRLPFYYLDFLSGVYRLNRLESGADKYLLKYVNNFKGKNYIKEAYLKLAWYEYAINNNSDGFYKYLELCKVHGEMITDEDKYAMRFAEKAVLPDRILLRARTLFDGGYYQRAIEEIGKINGGLNDNDLIEYHYRKGRIFFEQRKYNESLSELYAVINSPEKSEDYHVKSLYFIALTYERVGYRDLAKQFYEKVINENSGVYKSSLEQKAKAGLSRLKE